MAVHRAGLAMVPLLALFPSLLIVSAAFFCFICFLRRGKIQPRSVGFFHPYTNDGGGGERVLWCAVRAVQEELPDISCVIYTGDDATPESLAARALDRFGVRLPSLPLVLRKMKMVLLGILFVIQWNTVLPVIIDHLQCYLPASCYNDVFIR
eukprot:c20401_g1_i2 orf=387-842(-)